MVKLLLESGAEVSLHCPKTPSLDTDALCLALEHRCCHEMIVLLPQKYAELGHLYLHGKAVAQG